MGGWERCVFFWSRSVYDRENTRGESDGRKRENATEHDVRYPEDALSLAFASRFLAWIRPIEHLCQVSA